MDDLRALTEMAIQKSEKGVMARGDNFEDLRDGPNPQLDVYVRQHFPRIITMGIDHGQPTDEPAAEETILSKLRQSHGNSARGPTLEMVVLAKDDSDTLLVRQSIFNDIFALFQLDPVMKQHIFFNGYGFHYYPHDAPFQDCHTFFFGSFLYSIVWSFNPKTTKTSAILMLRTIKRHGDGRAPYQTFKGCLQTFSHRLHTPFVLAFTAFAHLTHVLDEGMVRVICGLREVESYTKYGPTDRNGQHQQGARPGMTRQSTTVTLAQSGEDIEDLDQHSRELAKHNVFLANLLRHATLLTDMAEELRSTSFLDSYCRAIPEEYRASRDAEIKDFVSMVSIMARRIKTNRPSLDYLHDRAKSQFQVVFSLLTHMDAELNIKVARDSKIVAEATKKDSAAMKTIAFMTMLFLPGTFFAALFSIPALDWDTPGKIVVHQNFYMYWAFTLASTALILVLWFLWDKFKAQFDMLKKNKEKNTENRGCKNLEASTDPESGVVSAHLEMHGIMSKRTRRV